MNSLFQNPNRKKITVTIAISVLIHLFLFYLFKENLEVLGNKEMAKPVWVNLKNLQAPDRLVDMPKPLREEVPENPSAQALYNQKVKEETTNAMPMRPQAQQEQPEQKEIKEAHKTQENKVDEKKPQEQAPPSENENAKKAFEELTAMKKEEESPFNQPSQQRIPGMPGTSVSSAPFPDDYYPDYKIGNRTYINTQANLNLRYFVELKRKFKLTFNPVPSLRGRINEVSQGQISVVLGVSVNARGELVDIIFIRNSGIASYDQEGIRTVRSSSPFSAPPADMLNEEGLLHMAWNFIVYL